MDDVLEVPAIIDCGHYDAKEVHVKFSTRLCIVGATIAIAYFSGLGSLLADHPPQAGSTPGQATAKSGKKTEPVNLDRTKAGPVTRPHIVNIGNNTYFINEFGMDSQYLLIGKTRAMLIDTGTGFYDIRTTVEQLTKLPYDVVITHVGSDHGGMMGNFDTVYLHPADVPAISDMTMQGQKEAGEKMWNAAHGYRDLWGYTPADCKWAKYDKLPNVKRLSDGQKFDLGGGRIVTVFHLPGHTPGNCVLLDQQERILFSSDSVNPEYRSKGNTTVSKQLRGYLKLRDLRSQYDRMFGGHTAMGGTLDVFPLDPENLDDLIEICRQILRGEARPEQGGRNPAVQGKKVKASLNFDLLWEPGEPHVIP